MTIEQIEVIDAIGVDTSTQEIVLTISDHLEWSDNEHLYSLQEKLNTYLRFVESEEIIKTYPEAKDRQIKIDLVCKYQPDADGVNFLSQIKAIVENAGINFDYRVF